MRSVPVVVLDVPVVRDEVPAEDVPDVAVGPEPPFGLTQRWYMNSGLFKSRPVSSTATIVDGVPVVTLQASGASMSMLFAWFSPH